MGLICGLMNPMHTLAQYGGGTGTEEYPYLIYDPNHMQSIGAYPADWDKHFKLMNDIDLSAYDGQNGNPPFNVIGNFMEFGDPNRIPFSGMFDGNNHTISHDSLERKLSYTQQRNGPKRLNHI